MGLAGILFVASLLATLALDAEDSFVSKMGVERSPLVAASAKTGIAQNVTLSLSTVRFASPVAAAAKI